ESWLNTTSEAVRAIMIARLDTAKRKGCDAIDPDNTDGYTPDNHSGIGETQTDAEDYVRFLAQEAHNRGLAIGLKNSEDMVPNLVNIVDFAVVEEC
ncbi:glycoside hydrolase family 114 protein, partial [Stipitochalara longipes BDJ]